MVTTWSGGHLIVALLLVCSAMGLLAALAVLWIDRREGPARPAERNEQRA